MGHKTQRRIETDSEPALNGLSAASGVAEALRARDVGQPPRLLSPGFTNGVSQDGCSDSIRRLGAGNFLWEHGLQPCAEVFCCLLS